MMYIRERNINGVQITERKESWYDILKIGFAASPCLVVIGIIMIFATPFLAIHAAWEEFHSRKDKPIEKGNDHVVSGDNSGSE